MEELKATPRKASSMNESLSQIFKPHLPTARLENFSTSNQPPQNTKPPQPPNFTVVLLKSPSVGLP
jgi:hypothetical protein